MAPTAHAVMLPHLKNTAARGYTAPPGVCRLTWRSCCRRMWVSSHAFGITSTGWTPPITQLLASLRDNIMAVSDDMRAAPGIMQQMPQLPLTIDLNLAAAVLPPRMPPRSRTAAAASSGGKPRAGVAAAGEEEARDGARRRAGTRARPREK